MGVDCHGIAADAEGWIWAAGYGAGVVRSSADDLSMYAIVPGTAGRGSKGMAVDFDGNVWSINQGSEDATVIEPGPTLVEQTVSTGVVPHLVAPYTYSDMTGQQLRLATDPRGWYRRPFDGCTGPDERTVWRELRFDAEVPSGTLLRFRARTAESREALRTASWILVGEVPPLASPLRLDEALARAGIAPQRWLEVEVQLEAMRSSHVVSPRPRALTVTRVCDETVF